MKISLSCLNFIVGFEAIRLSAYLCPAGIPTIGIGTTLIHGLPVKLGMKCTKEQAMEYFEEHLAHEVYPYINKNVKVPLNQNQFDALSSLIYNIGCGNFLKSDLLKILNTGDYVAASKEFLDFNKSKGEVKSGLTTRRLAEQKMFNTVG